MSFTATFGDARVVSARVHTPAWGIPTAIVQFAEDDVIAPTAVLTIGDVSQVMTVERTGPYGGSRGAWLVAGFHGWRKTVARAQYRDMANGVKLGAVVRDVAAKVGEQVSIPAATAARVLGQFWGRAEGPASRTLADVVGQAWWIDPLGVTQLSERPTTTIGVDFDVVTPARPELGRYTLASEDLAVWVPGAVWSFPGIVDEPQLVSSVTLDLRVGGVLRLEVMSA